MEQYVDLFIILIKNQPLPFIIIILWMLLIPLYVLALLFFFKVIKENNKVRKVLSLLLFFNLLTFFLIVLIFEQQTSSILQGTWVCKQSGIKETCSSGFTAKKSKNNRITLIFTKEGTVTTYLNNVKLSTDKYEIKKGISTFDKREHDFLSFKGSDYIIKTLDKNNLIITDNPLKGHYCNYKRQP